MENNRALILSGGGARAAYQVGVLSAIGKMLPKGTPLPFSILCGTSAGALNAAMLATNAGNFTRAISRLSYIWRHLTPDQVYQTRSADLLSSLSKILFSVFHHGYATGRPLSLLDNAPLRQLIERFLDLDQISVSINQRHLKALAITAMSYTTGITTTFFQGRPELTPWSRSRREGLISRITFDHLLASAAIPTIFPPQKIGDDYFGDGAMRQHAPISPALHLGAEKVLVIGVSGNRNPKHWAPREPVKHSPSIAQITGQLLNSAFIDSMEADIEHLERINTLLTLGGEPLNDAGVRPVETLIISPSQELDRMAAEQFHTLPRSVRVLLSASGGSSSDGGSAAASYLMFTPEYCQALMELGYKDTMWEREKVLAFLDLP